MKIGRACILILLAILPFPFFGFASYLIEVHTKDGRLAMWAIFASQKMTDQQIAHAIGQDPWALIQRVGRMTDAVDPIIAAIVGILVALVAKRKAVRFTPYILAPFFLWDFYMSAFSTLRPPLQAAIFAAKVLGNSAACIAIAVLSAAIVSWLINHKKSLSPLRAA